jgi:hypothetical protein
MHPRAHVEALGSHIGAGTHDDVAARLLRPALDPVDVVAVEQHVAEPIASATIRSDVIGERHEP